MADRELVFLTYLRDQVRWRELLLSGSSSTCLPWIRISSGPPHGRQGAWLLESWPRPHGICNWQDAGVSRQTRVPKPGTARCDTGISTSPHPPLCCVAAGSEGFTLAVHSEVLLYRGGKFPLVPECGSLRHKGAGASHLTHFLGDWRDPSSDPSSGLMPCTCLSEPSGSRLNDGSRHGSMLSI